MNWSCWAPSPSDECSLPNVRTSDSLPTVVASDHEAVRDKVDPEHVLTGAVMTSLLTGAGRTRSHSLPSSGGAAGGGELRRLLIPLCVFWMEHDESESAALVRFPRSQLKKGCRATMSSRDISRSNIAAGTAQQQQ